MTPTDDEMYRWMSGAVKPEQPWAVSPLNGQSNVVGTTLQWDGVATTFDVYCSETQNLVANFRPAACVAQGLTVRSHQAKPGAIKPGATYYWAIAAMNKAGSTRSEVYRFTTALADQPTDCVLSPWSDPPWAPAGAWSDCTGGKQSQAQTRTLTRTIVTPPANGGAACGVTTQTETRTIVRDCSAPTPGTKTLLTPEDFTYLGYYDAQTSGQNSPYGQSLTHRYVNGEFRFLYCDHSSSGIGLTETPCPAGTPFGSLLNNWSDWWMPFGEVAGAAFFGLWWDEETGHLWTTSGPDYTVTVWPVSIYAHTLGSVGGHNPTQQAPHTSHGWFELAGINAKRVYGKIQRVPPAFRAQHSVGEFIALGGGYTSLMNQGGGCSLGPAFYFFANPLGLPDGGTSVPFQVAADHAVGNTDKDWYADGAPSHYDRGVRSTPVVNYYDRGDPRQNPDTPPSIPPVATAGWQSPAPDGVGRWVWGDSYYDTGNWIDGDNKHGILLVASLATGRAWYQGSTLHSDGRGAELQIFDPEDLGQVVGGTRQPWNVKPRHTLTLTLEGLGDRGTLGNTPVGNPGGATYDAQTGRLYIHGLQGGGTFVNRIYVYQVAR